MSDVGSVKSTFSGCSNLEEVNFEGINTNKLTKMENTFENCINIKKLDLSPLNTANLIETNNIFTSCNKLDLSSFKNINNSSIFSGITSIPNIIANYLISNKINEIFKKQYNIQINIIINYDSSTACQIGEKEKCKTCNNNSKLKNQCESCNEGYYLSEDGNKTICEKCDIEGCSICSRTKKNKIYNLCAKNYILNNNECIEEECDLGEHERCESCRTEKGRKKNV